MKLSELKTGERGIIVKVTGRKSFCKRISEMGFVKGQRVEVILNAPLKDPVEYKIMGYEVSLRKSESDLIEIITEKEVEEHTIQKNQPLTIQDKHLREVAIEKSKNINVALVGNPNCGKTSLFNFVSGAHARVGNYTGVTVDAKESRFKHRGYTFKIADLPGTYSLSPYSPEELYVRNYIHDEHPDIIINVIDSSNIQRNLYLTTQLIDMDVSAVVALNMYDEFKEKGSRLDSRLLSELIGFPIIPTVSKTGEGIRELFDEVIEVYERRSRVNRHIHINYGSVLEPEIEKTDEFLHKGNTIGHEESCRYLGIKLLEGDGDIEEKIKNLPNGEEIIKFRDSKKKK